MVVNLTETVNTESESESKEQFFSVITGMWGDGLAQWLEHWTGDLKVERSNPVRSTRKTLCFSESKRLC